MTKQRNGHLCMGFAEGEWVYVDGPCVVKVQRCGTTRLKFIAPRETNVARGELLSYEKRKALGMTVDEPSRAGGW